MSLKFKEIIRYEKSHMNEIRYIMNYRIVPGYLLLIIICVMMSIDETKYTPLAILLFGIIGLLTVLLLASGPFVRKKEIQMEMGRYNFERREIEPTQIFDFSNEENSIQFDSNGMTVNDAFYWYNHLTVRVITSNYLLRIIINIIFIIDEMNCYQIPFNGDTIDMIRQFDIKLENPDDFEYIVNHKENAFRKIFLKGHV